MTASATTVQATRVLIGGVDTHQRTHHAAIVDEHQQPIADREFPVTAAGYAALLDWMASHGLLSRVGVESTGSYGAGLARHLLAAGIEVFEVQRPEKTSRHHQGKSDALDAYSAARQAATGTAHGRLLGLPKARTGVVEAIRMIKVPRDSAVKHRTAAYSQLRDLVTTTPGVIHDELITMTGPQRVKRAAGYRPNPALLADPVQAAKRGLRDLARRIQALDAEIAAADKDLTRLTTQAVPSLLAMRQIGTQTAAQLLITAGENITRMRTEATFAKLCGVAPLPASSGQTTPRRHRLNRGGDRQANAALHLAIIGRMKNDPATRNYLQLRLAQGKTKPEIIRSLKRLLARSAYRALRNDLTSP
jgi:transposase